MENKQARAIKTRQDILNGAARVFVGNGYEKATVGNIAAAAGVTQGALYFHFKSKEEIAHAVIDAQHTISQHRAEVILSNGLSGVETILQISASLARDIIDDPLVRAGVRLNTEVLFFEQPIIRSWDDWAALAAGLLEQGVKDGDLRTDTDIPVFSRVISRCYVGVQLVSEQTTKYEDLAERIMEMWIVILSACLTKERQAVILDLARSILMGPGKPEAR